MRTIQEALEETLRRTEQLAPLPAATEEALLREWRDAGDGVPVEGRAHADLAPELLEGVRVRVRIELGRLRARLSEILALREGDVIDLGRKVGEPVDIYVQDTLIARGDVLVVDRRLCVRITEVVRPGVEVER